MPIAVQIILGLAAVLTALGVLWTKALRPGARLITNTEEMLPLLREMTAAFKNTPTYFSVLHDVAAEFKSDSGSTLRDVVNRLESASERLQDGAATDRRMDERDREQMASILRDVDRLTVKIDTNVLVIIELQSEAVKVAQDLRVSKQELTSEAAKVARELQKEAAHVAQELRSARLELSKEMKNVAAQTVEEIGDADPKPPRAK